MYVSAQETEETDMKQDVPHSMHARRPDRPLGAEGSAPRTTCRGFRASALLLACLLFLPFTAGLPGSILRVEAATTSGAAAQPSQMSGAVMLYVGSNLARVRDVLTPIDPGRNGTAPFLLEGRTMVPVRFLAESVGGSVSYEASTGTAVIRLGTRTVKLRGGSVNLVRNGIPIRMQVAPVLRNGRMYAPLRSVAEALGHGVFYEDGLICVSPGEPFLDAVRDAAAIDAQIQALGMVRVAASEAELMAQLTAWKDARTYAGRKSGAVTTQVLPELAASESGNAIGQAADAAVPAPAASATTEAAPADSGDNHSLTNVQVAGVDEGDILKTDGSYLFQVNRMRVLVIRAVPADDMKLVAAISLGAESISPTEIYVADKRLTIIGTAMMDLPAGPVGTESGTTAVTTAMTAMSPAKPAASPIVSPVEPAIEPDYRYMPPQEQRLSTKVLTYDLADPAKPVRTGTYEIEGSLLASRRIGSRLYLVTSKNLSPWLPGTDTPYWRSGNGTSQRIEPTTVSWCPDFEEANYLVVSGLDLADPTRAPGMYTLLGAGQTVYATADSLFVAVRRGQSGDVILPATMTLPGTMKAANGGILPTTESTDIYRFALQDGNASLMSRGTVPGRLLNQFSMDWYGEVLRVATTTGWASRTGTSPSVNQVYTLDAMMNILGGIPDIAPGEQIYSARFLGNRGFLVTYRTVDPLYALDLTDPRKPFIQGELKIPGYSDYLHPYDENHLIGFGKDSVELASDWDPGSTWAYYQGMKVALFDVTDLGAPRLMDEVHIGDRGTYSELLTNHRALLFSKSRNLIAFPLSLYKVGGAAGITDTGDTTSGTTVTQTDPLTYGELAWQGLTAYRVTLASGFSKLADISHLEPGDLWNQERYVQRGAYVGDVLYTLSNREVRAHDMTDWQEIGRLVLP